MDQVEAFFQTILSVSGPIVIYCICVLQEVKCEEEGLQQIITTAVTKLHQSITPVKS